MERLNLCKEVLENAIGVHRTLEKIEPLQPLDIVAVQAMEELLQYKTAEEQGLLKMFPCKVGDTVFYPEEEINYIYPVKISKIIVFDSEIMQYDGCFFDGNGDPSIEFEFDYADFGKTVFLTREEAEKALKQIKGE